MVSVFVSVFVFVFVFVFVSVFQGVGMDLYLHLLLHWLEATTLGPAGSTSGSNGKPAALLDNYQRHVLANPCLEPSSFLFCKHTSLFAVSCMRCCIKTCFFTSVIYKCLCYQFKALCLKASSSLRCRNCSENNKSRYPRKTPKSKLLKSPPKPRNLSRTQIE